MAAQTLHRGQLPLRIFSPVAVDTSAGGSSGIVKRGLTLGFHGSYRHLRVTVRAGLLLGCSRLFPPWMGGGTSRILGVLRRETFPPMSCMPKYLSWPTI